ncbi:glutaminase A [Paenibacillus thiaminolyticus]|uniref:Glutaminase n=1 Tax=Paenibacillus thiaminolyticus TaxID=49283 RepID=A0AAP9J367_PANTH|nr:glutaminase A [Paenibacillus thiaminolyticus]MCY9537079.1 glutaminase A [Paenibacillus thiaminolyticus]MCY9603162.1 glutaminase A [Paenibacillus thiaminolyticus]MCY9607992.1 glutaminase A [Paenibacillus thiaminolyticus]MCY9613609.1 glutaminase A [Paenibacillus thiaminolyticus]MCY9618771.1 glutaminase A [Paenibacillus thiaminolyticus]
MIAAHWNELERELPQWLEESRRMAAAGKVATYIPGLAEARPDALGISLCGIRGERVKAGETEEPFTMQSVSKVFSLLLALLDSGEAGVFAKVGKEPTGDDFNSILKLELVDPGKPFNPFINAGAIAIASLIEGRTPEEKSERLLEFVRMLADDPSITWNKRIYESERETAYRNRSLAYYLKDNGILEGDVEATLDVYFRQCAIEVRTCQLARMALVLANRGCDPATGHCYIPRKYVQIATSFMTTCGMYNASGEFALEAGIPAKSGVSGGIMALIPGQLGIGVYGPALNEKGNSVAGVHMLAMLSERFEWSIF